MVTEGRRRMVREDEAGEIKKGPWKAEEDEVLISHVRRHGPREWSSIRSKGLLQRTGKSCRLRWVNKLRPNLKTGVKFSAEEERTVIDLQAQFGNKWAKIATYLSGRTDNDVKNFWSSRQKRLSRILQTSASSSYPSHTTTTNRIVLSSGEAPKLSTSTEEESVAKIQSCCSSSHIPYSDTIKMEPILPDFMYHSYGHIPFQFECTPPEKKSSVGPHFHIPDPLPLPQLQPELFPLAPLESQEFITRLGDLNFVDHVYGGQYSTTSAQLPILSSSSSIGKGETNDVATPASFADDFLPMEMFDQIEPLPSPSKW